MKIIMFLSRIPLWFSMLCFTSALLAIALFAPELFLAFFVVGTGMVTILVLIDLLFFPDDWIKPEKVEKQWTEDEL